MPSLYKYTPHQIDNPYCYDIITKNELRFSPVSSFNDPLDSNLDYRQEYTEAEIQAYWAKFHVGKTGLQPLEHTLKQWGTNDNFTEKQKQARNTFRNCFGVLCMSEAPVNILMWSHYANNHKGIVYEFFRDSLFPHQPELKPIKVTYEECNTYPLLDYTKHGEDNKKQLVSELLTKAQDWSYEKEYRYIDLAFNGNKAFNKDALRSIVFGVKTEESEKRHLRELCQQHGLTHVVFKQAYFEHGTFIINLRDL